ncbi:MAG: DegV family protein [Bacillota bacterium]
MSKIKLITDSTCDLSKALIEQHGIEVVPLFVNLGEQSYKDGVDITPTAMYKKVQEEGLLPTTAAASSETFRRVFKKYLDEGYEILYLGIGSGFSSTLQSAHIAKNELESDKIHLVDSMNLSSGSGLLLLKAARLREEGLSAQAIKESLEAMVPNVRTQFVINTLEYLHKGGRLKAISAFMGTMLRIKPIILVRDGAMTIGKKPRGNIRVGVKLLLKDVLKNLESIDPEFIMITHTEASAQADYIRNELKKTNHFDQIYETEAGCVISSHCGPGTIGILYIMK